MQHLKRLYIYSMLLMSFAIALFPIGSHLEMCSNNKGHCHIILNFCNIEINHQTVETKYNADSNHTSCQSSAVFHKTEILLGNSLTQKTDQPTMLLEYVFATKAELRKTLRKYNFNDYTNLSFLFSPHIIRSTILII